MHTIYHNPRCRKSRAGLEYLKSKTDEIEIVEYLKEPLTQKQWTEVFEKLDLKPSEMLRKQEEAYKKELKGKDFSEKEWIEIFTENPKLIQRPIIVKGNQAIWGNPPENIDKLLD